MKPLFGGYVKVGLKASISYIIDHFKCLTLTDHLNHKSEASLDTATTSV